MNTGARDVAIAREGINRFLKADGGHLAHPTTVAILTDEGLKFEGDFSQDGNALSATLDHDAIPLRVVNIMADYRSGERSQMTLRGLGEIVAHEGPRPGRKMIIWLSPGWLLIFGPKRTLDAKTEQQVFGNVVDTSTQLRGAQITLYSVDPLGTADSGRTWEAYLKGVSKPSQVRMEDLSLGVIATQSGGLALNSGNDIAAQLEKCVADAGAYYEISFDPSVTGRTNEYHQLEVHVEKPDLTARTRRGYYAQPPRAGTGAAESAKLGGEQDETPSHKLNTESAASADTSDQVDYANAQSYVDLPMAQLVERIPELKALQLVADQQELPIILQKMGERIDDFLHNISDLIARENLTQERLNADGKIKTKQHVQDNYLILHHGYSWGASAEYRMDDKGNRLGQIGLERGYLVTSGYALSCIQFSTLAQSQAQSRFRYLGGEMLGSRETYVLAFAQRPDEVSFANVMTGTGAKDVDVPTQGILWVDKTNFQILRMRSDLLAPNGEIQLDQLKTDVTFSEVRLQDVPNPVWLPSDVDVSMEIDKQKFHNVHHYTNYRR